MTRQRALVYIHFAAVLFGLTGVFGELIQASAAVITLGRAAFAVAALAGFARMQRRPLFGALTPAQLFMLIVAGGLLAAHWVTFFISVKTGGIAIATLGFASFPAFITLFEALLFRERVRMAEWLLLALVTSGLVLVTPSFDFADQGTVGLAWGLLSGLSFALLALTNRRSTVGLDPMQVACGQNIVVVLAMLPFAASQLPMLPALDWLWLALLGIFCTGLSHFFFVSSLTRLNARSAGLVIALEPVYAIAFAWMLFAQQPTLRMAAGAALIVAAIVWSGLRKAPH
ncbi:EamA family transporter [Bordetella genomosp. 7]|uniref:EamA family transporter n=1 Tax=Bordetella genomosp. 7 TaxID=1416805 RepID=A0A261RF24_9BORD|nr:MULTISPECIES: DMT family transporter [Bordetella]OZI22933.1 EamA family transporter [Bordetella genomosp. 7]OZI25732.1 EamA family transporter [Bordetella genomosp. 7]